MLNTKWKACERDDWLNTKYIDKGNKLSWIPGYKSWKKERGGSRVVPTANKSNTNKGVYYGYSKSEEWKDHNTKAWKNSFKNAYIDNKTGKWVHLCKCSNGYNPFTNCKCKYGYYYDTTSFGDSVCKRFPKNDEGNPCIHKDNIGKKSTSLNNDKHRIGDFYNLMNPICNFHSPDGKNGLYRSNDVNKTLSKCCASCMYKFYASNLPYSKLSTKLPNNELNEDYKQPWSDNGKNEIVGYLKSNIHPNIKAGFNETLNIPIGYNSRPPYYYPVWNMDPGAAGEYKPLGVGHQGEDKNYTGFLLNTAEGGKSRCSDGSGNPGEETCEDSDNKVIHNNLFHCKRGGWKDDSYGTTPPRGSGSTVEDKEIDTYKLYDYDWVNNKWIKKDEKYKQYGYYGGTRNCKGGNGWKKGGDGEREARHIEKTCNGSGYWLNGNLRKCKGKYHLRKNSWSRNEHHATCS